MDSVDTACTCFFFINKNLIVILKKKVFVIRLSRERLIHYFYWWPFHNNIILKTDIYLVLVKDGPFFLWILTFIEKSEQYKRDILKSPGKKKTEVPKATQPKQGLATRNKKYNKDLECEWDRGTSLKIKHPSEAVLLPSNSVI